jgi:hypothetical protein
MELEKRLIKLAADVAIERQAEFIKEWPKKIKREAVYLSDLITPEKVSEAIKINKGTLQTWIKKFSSEEDLSFNFERVLRKFNFTNINTVIFSIKNKINLYPMLFFLSFFRQVPPISNFI